MFAGIVALDSAFPVRQAQEDLRQALDSHISNRSGEQSLVQACESAVFVRNGGRQPKHDVPSTGNVLFVSESRLDNLGDLARDFGTDIDEPSCIRASFERRGDAGIAALLGGFTFAHWDPASRTLTMARDYLGRRALFYYHGGTFVAFASNLVTLLTLPAVPRLLDERMLAHFLAFQTDEPQATVYRDICRVPSRTVVRITPCGTDRRHYWSPRPAPPRAIDSDYIAEARHLFDRAMTRVLRDLPRAAIYLSGGLDSSAVAATAMRLGTTEIVGFTGLPPPDLDVPIGPRAYRSERDKVEALATLYPGLRVRFMTSRGTHWRQSEPTRYFPYVPLPFSRGAGFPWFAQMQDSVTAAGYSVALTGRGGNFTISWTGELSLADQLANGRWLALMRDARIVARQTGRGLLRVLARDAVIPGLPRPILDALARLRGIELYAERSLLRREVVQDFDLPSDWRKTGVHPIFQPYGSSSAWRAAQIFDMRQMGRDYDQLAVEAGLPEQRSPFQDRDLIEFCLGVPETLYRRNGMRRWFARQVFADRLPRIILQEARVGVQGLNWFEALNAQKATIVEMVEHMEASRLASCLIDLPRLKRLIAEWPKDAREAQARQSEFRSHLDRAVQLGQFIRWVEGGNG